MKLEEYNYIIKHISGQKNGVADAPSHINIYTNIPSRKYDSIFNILLCNSSIITIFIPLDLKLLNSLTQSCKQTLNKGEITKININHKIILIDCVKESKTERRDMNITIQVIRGIEKLDRNIIVLL